MTAESSSQTLLQMLHEESGKPVVVQSDPKVSGHATIRLATGAQPAHILRYKPAHEALRPYLIAFQCGLALRQVRTEPQFRFGVARTATAGEEALRLVREHLQHTGSTAYEHLAPQLTEQFVSGLGTQLRSMPISLRIDSWLDQEYPDLRELQRQSIVIQLQEAMQSLGPEVKAIAPPEIVDANVAMSTAFAKFWSGRWNDAAFELPFVSAGYDKIGSELLAMVNTANPAPNGDRELVESWARHLKLDRWFQVIDG